MLRSRESSQRKSPENYSVLTSTHWLGHDHQHVPSKEQQTHDHYYGGKISIIRPRLTRKTLLIDFIKKFL